MLDNAADGPLPEGYEDCLSLAKAALTMLTIGVQDDAGKLLAVLGAMAEMTLKHIDDPDERAEITMEFVQTLANHIGLSTQREDRASHR